MSNLPTPSSSLPIPSTTRARKRRAKRGIVANYIHEISPRHRAATPVPVTAAPASMPVPAVAVAGAPAPAFVSEPAL